MDEQDLDRRLHAAARHISVPDRPLRRPSSGSVAKVGAIAIVVAVLAGTLVVGQQLSVWRRGGVAASPTLVASSAPGSPAPSASPSATGTPRPSVPPLTVSYESGLLGYHIELPAGFRRSDCLSGVGGKDGRLGGDTFTLLSPQEEGAKELGHIARGGEVAMWTFQVTVFRADGMSALELAERGGCPLCDRNTAAQAGYQIESTALGGYEAARVVIAREVRQFVVRASDRLYVIDLYFDEALSERMPRPTVLPAGVLDAVARTFEARSVGSLPTPTPDPNVPPPGTRDLAAQLERALEASDADRLTGLATPRCWLRMWLPNAGPTGRPVDQYIAELRDRFAAGLRVTVDPIVQVAQEAGPGGGRFFVRSDWAESARTTPADLYLHEVDGRWYWAGAQFYMPGP